MGGRLYSSPACDCRLLIANCRTFTSHCRRKDEGPGLSEDSRASSDSKGTPRAEQNSKGTPRAYQDATTLTVPEHLLKAVCCEVPCTGLAQLPLENLSFPR